ncbi:TniQ family protein [Cupriavidus basilensis]|uniref:TniQ family protein n=1 Tax=Cupriavidus basilensis TaxID=68895 RepID=UPI0039F6AA18
MSLTSNTPGTACYSWSKPWPIAPRPCDGEAFGGWLGRIAGKYSITVEQLWSHADIGPIPALTYWKWLLFPPVSLETLERLSQLTHVSVDRLVAMQTPIGWVHDRRRLRYCYPCLILNPSDVCSPFWRREWLDPSFSMCMQHPGRVETTWHWCHYKIGNFSQLLRKAHALPHRDIVSY